MAIETCLSGSILFAARAGQLRHARSEEKREKGTEVTLSIRVLLLQHAPDGISGCNQYTV
jgi:hypothetical protein